MLLNSVHLSLHSDFLYWNLIGELNQPFWSIPLLSLISFRSARGFRLVACRTLKAGSLWLRGLHRTVSAKLITSATC